MEDIGGVNVLEAAEDLIDERLVVGVCEGLTGADDGVEVCFEEFDVEVNGVKVVSVHDVHVVQTNDLPRLGGDKERKRSRGYVFVTTEVFEEFEFTKRSFSEDSFGEDVGDLFHRNRVPRIDCLRRTIRNNVSYRAKNSR